MDRNMGAISASPGNIGALGLLYQWGRKDPFLGSSSTGGYVVTNSTISWPDVCNERKGMSYAIKIQQQRLRNGTNPALSGQKKQKQSMIHVPQVGKWLITTIIPKQGYQKAI